MDVAYPYSRIGSQMNITGQSFASTHMPPIAEEENKRMRAVRSSWDSSTIRDLKRGRDNNGRTFPTSILLETQVLSYTTCQVLSASCALKLSLCEILYRLERGTKYSLQECGNLFPVDAFQKL